MDETEQKQRLGNRKNQQPHGYRYIFFVCLYVIHVLFSKVGVREKKKNPRFECNLIKPNWLCMHQNCIVKRTRRRYKMVIHHMNCIYFILYEMKTFIDRPTDFSCKRKRGVETSLNRYELVRKIGWQNP